ncbi:uncharacterized protein K452DRAFT_339586 [Aplosporella prunicola CBS 121167]|uniref:Uncharacterized protein n=1 Tax=Aplosporella prunicola CBS 121167 TaxID=1176127 RepID=A0A6A6B1I8_9PEZI|nr:uncharacterized protein K452DRAFT_339586 [Aplosporella prunicola CBS 121167]KAF2137910.1 hypothetical protein K452DRAFT_339586 [Aplosporella prunicola CBS 121167]
MATISLNAAVCPANCFILWQTGKLCPETSSRFLTRSFFQLSLPLTRNRRTIGTKATITSFASRVATDTRRTMLKKWQALGPTKDDAAERSTMQGKGMSGVANCTCVCWQGQDRHVGRSLLLREAAALPGQLLLFAVVECRISGSGLYFVSRNAKASEPKFENSRFTLTKTCRSKDAETVLLVCATISQIQDNSRSQFASVVTSNISQITGSTSAVVQGFGYNSATTAPPLRPRHFERHATHEQDDSAVHVPHAMETATDDAR